MNYNFLLIPNMSKNFIQWTVDPAICGTVDRVNTSIERVDSKVMNLQAYSRYLMITTIYNNMIDKFERTVTVNS
jgi:hypothetical protein